MNKREELLKNLLKLAHAVDAERGHRQADEALLDYIGDPEITKAFKAIERWYA